MTKINILAIIAIATLSLVACKKDRVCECTSKRSNSSVTTTGKVTYTESTKRQANANCVSSSSESNGVTYTDECKLK